MTAVALNKNTWDRIFSSHRHSFISSDTFVRTLLSDPNHIYTCMWVHHFHLSISKSCDEHQKVPANKIPELVAPNYERSGPKKSLLEELVVGANQVHVWVGCLNRESMSWDVAVNQVSVKVLFLVVFHNYLDVNSLILMLYECESMSSLFSFFWVESE